MKNIFGKEESLKLYNDDGNLVYKYYINSRDFSYEDTFDSNGEVLTYRNSNGYSHEYTRDSYGNVLTYKNPNGYSYEFTRDSDGNELTFKDSKGNKRGFNIPEYTMEELVEKLGNFKIKK